MAVTFEPKQDLKDFKCGICLDHNVDNVLAHDNTHPFHGKCIAEWAIINPSCPICRKPIDKIGNILLVPPLLEPDNNRMIGVLARIHDIWQRLERKIDKGTAVFFLSLIGGNISALTGIKIGTTLNGSFQSLKDWEGDNLDRIIQLFLPQVVAAVSGIATLFFSSSKKVLRAIQWTQLAVFPLLNIVIIHQLGVSYLGMGLGALVGAASAGMASRKIRKQFS